MMAKTHALSGVLFVTAWGAIADATPSEMALAITLVPGFALLPDIDHAKSLVSSTFGPFTRVFAFFLGHRRETHSFPGVAVLGLATWLAALHPENVVARCWLSLVLVLAWAALLRVLGVRGWFAEALPMIATTIVVWHHAEWVASGLPPYPLELIPTALVFGMLIHIAGDCLTNSGCPLWWPFSKKRTAFSFRLRPKGKRRSIRTNSKFEKRVIVALLWLGSIGSTLLWVVGLA